MNKKKQCFKICTLSPTLSFRGGSLARNNVAECLQGEEKRSYRRGWWTSHRMALFFVSDGCLNRPTEYIPAFHLFCRPSTLLACETSYWKVDMLKTSTLCSLNDQKALEKILFLPTLALKAIFFLKFDTCFFTDLIKNGQLLFNFIYMEESFTISLSTISLPIKSMSLK